MRIGAIAAAIACLDEIIYATAVWASIGSQLFLSISFKAFNVVYLGVALIILSLVMLAIKPVQLAQRTVAALLGLAVARCAGKKSSHERTKDPQEGRLVDPRTKVYRHVIALKDMEAQEGIPLGPFTTRILYAGERILTQSAPVRTQDNFRMGEK
jgi:hypothetical protein